MISELDIEPEPVREIGQCHVEDTTAVIHVVNIDDFDALDDEKTTPHNTNKKLVLTLLFSIALHIVAFYIISLRIQLPTFSEETETPTVIKATLYTPPAPISEPAISEPKATQPIAVPEAETQKVMEESLNPSPVEEAVVPQETTSSPPTVPEPQVIAPPTAVAETNQPTPETLPDVAPPAPKAKPKSLYSTKASTDIRRLQRQKRNSMASQAFREFQYKKTHPEIKTEPQTSLQLSAEEKRQIASDKHRKDIAVSVDCKKRGAKALRFISGIAGGNVDCQKNPALQSFIKNRVDKVTREPRK